MVRVISKQGDSTWSSYGSRCCVAERQDDVSDRPNARYRGADSPKDSLRSGAVWDSVGAPESGDVRGGAFRGLTIEWGAVLDGNVYYVKLRNDSTQAFDLTEFNLTDQPEAQFATGRIELVRGSSRLSPGDDALVVTNPMIPTDDEGRGLYANLFHLVAPDGTTVSLRRDGLTLIDPNGYTVTGPEVEDTQPGRCCAEPSGTYHCGIGCNTFCVSGVTFQECRALDGCCHEVGVMFCANNNCNGVNPTYCTLDECG